MTANVLEGRKVALVHDWLTGMRGGEKCLEVLCELFPEADLYTLIHQKGELSDTIENIIFCSSMMLTSCWLPILNTSPLCALSLAALMNPSVISSIQVNERVWLPSPCNVIGS